MATMFFSDIVGFTNIAAAITPDQVSDMLDRLYLKFDALSEKHDIFKIETIGDAYVGVTNLVKRQDEDHAKRIAEFAIDTVRAAAETPVLLDDPSMGCVKIRVGIHSGPLIARVVGSRNPRYCVFGDTVNTAARMESNSIEGRIQCSDMSAKLLTIQCMQIPLTARGPIQIKGKGEMETFFVGSVLTKNPPENQASRPKSECKAERYELPNVEAPIPKIECKAERFEYAEAPIPKSECKTEQLESQHAENLIPNSECKAEHFDLHDVEAPTPTSECKAEQFKSQYPMYKPVTESSKLKQPVGNVLQISIGTPRKVN